MAFTKTPRKIALTILVATVAFAFVPVRAVAEGFTAECTNVNGWREAFASDPTRNPPIDGRLKYQGPDGYEGAKWTFVFDARNPSKLQSITGGVVLPGVAESAKRTIVSLDAVARDEIHLMAIEPTHDGYWLLGLWPHAARGIFVRLANRSVWRDGLGAVFSAACEFNALR